MPNEYYLDRAEGAMLETIKGSLKGKIKSDIKAHFIKLRNEKSSDLLAGEINSNERRELELQVEIESRKQIGMNNRGSSS